MWIRFFVPVFLIMVGLAGCSGGKVAPATAVGPDFTKQRFNLVDGTSAVLSVKVSQHATGVRVCGAWQPFGGTAFGDRAAGELVARSKLYLSGDKLLDRLAFFKELNADQPLAERKAGCRDLEVPWKASYVTGIPQIIVPRVSS